MIGCKRLLNFFFLVVFLFLYATGYSSLNGKILYIALLSVSALLVYRTYIARNISLFVVFVYMSTYIFVLYYVFFCKDIQVSYYMDFNTPPDFYRSSLAHFFFLIIINSTIKIVNAKEVCYLHVCDKPVIFLFGVIGCIIAIVFGKSGDVGFLSEGGYSPDFVRSPLFEYFFIFFLLAYFSRGKTPIKKYILYVIVLTYVFKNTIYGGRIETLMCFLCLLVIEFQFRIKFKYLLALLFVGYISSYLLSIMRSTGLSLDVISNIDIQNVDIIITQESDVNYSSARILALVEKGVITVSDRLMSLLYLIISIFVSKDNLPPLADLSLYMQSEYSCGGGGFISSFFYVFASYLGVALIALFISYILSIGLRNPTLNFKNIFFILVITTLPRWFAYYPISLFKLALIGGVFIVVFLRIKKLKS